VLKGNKEKRGENAKSKSGGLRGGGIISKNELGRVDGRAQGSFSGGEVGGD